MSARPAPQGSQISRKKPGAAPAGLQGLGFDPVVAAAWLYYQDQLTQSEIAVRLGVSRATVVNLLGESRRRGLVQVTIDPHCLAQVELARAITARYGLADTVLVPDDGSAEPPAGRIGVAGAQLLVRELRAGDRIGVSFGRTVLALSKALPPVPPAVEGIEVVQVTGSLTPKSAFSPELCTLNVATALGGHSNHLHAPMFVSSPRVKAILMAEPSIERHFALIRSCNRIVFGVAALDADGTIFESGMFQREAVAPSIDEGAVAILASHFVAADGRHVKGLHDDVLIGMTLDDLRGVGQRICVSGGPEKTRAIHAALAGGYVTHLVTDERTARALLAED